MFRLLAANVLDYAIFVVDPQRHVLTWSKGAARLLGYSDEEIVGRPCDCLFTPEDVHAGVPQRELEEALATGRGEDDRWHVRKDGSRFWSSGVTTPLRDEAGALRGFAKIMRDRTEFRRAEDALKESEERHRLIAETAHDGIWLIDADARTLFLNRRMAELLGCMAEDVLGRTVPEFCFEEDLPQARERIGANLQGRTEQFDFRFRRADGTEVLVLACTSPMRDAAGCVVGALGMFSDITERKRLEESLRESEEKFRQLAENIEDVFWMGDPHRRRVLYVSPAYERVWGRSCAALYADFMEWLDAIHPDDRGRVEAAFFGRVLEGGYDEEYRVARPDGTLRWVRDRGFPIRDGTGAVVRVVGTAEDVTARKQATEALREGEERFRATVQQAAVGVAHVGLDGRTLWANPGLCLMLGFTEAELREKTVADVTHPDDLEADSALARRLLAGEIPSYRIEKRYRHKDGSVVWGDLAVSLVRDSEGQPKYVVGVLVDITGRKQVEARLEAVLAGIDDHLACYDRQWRYTFVNDKAAQILGKSKEELLGKSIWEVFPDAVGNQYYQEVHKALAEQRVIRSEHYYAPFETWFENHVYPTPDGVTVFSADVTWRKRLEDELRRHNERLAEADRRKDEFLAMLAHELRNPLAPIRNALHVLKMPGADGAIFRQARDLAERQVQHMARLLDDLLDVSRISRGRIELRKDVLDVTAVVHRSVEAVRPLFEERGHELTVSLPPQSLRVEADATRLEQVVTNLLNNAAKYTDPGGQVWLTAQHAGGDLVLRVRDTGIGIAPDMLPRIFDLFVQAERRLDRSQGGVGIGLTLVKKLVEMHGGTVEARSAGAGRGSEFVVRLPAAPEEPAAGRTAGSTTEAGPPPVPCRRVLVVDDNVDAADSLALLLQLTGQEVRVAHDGPTALLVAAAFRPQVILLDIGMPGMDGYEVARRLRRQPEGRAALVVALTGWGQDGDRRRSAEAGFDHHLVKPVEPDALGKLLAECDLRR